MTLTKIPVILLVTLGLGIVQTPPHPPPAKEEHIPSSAIDFPSARQFRIKTIHAVQALAALAEVTTILANTFPSSKLSRVFVSKYGMSLGHANNLRLTPLSALGAGLIIAAAALRLSTYRALGRLFTFHISIQDDHRLVTTGPYSVVRHPSYAGLVVAHLGWVFWNASSGSWVRESGMWKNLVGKIFITAYAAGILGASSMVTLSRMSNEDAALRERFGKEWDEWAKRVLYKVFPGVY